MFGKDFHFLGTNIREWKTSTDINEVIKHMSKEEFSYLLFYVPLPADASYSIKNFTPVVEGVVYLGTYKNKKREEV